MADYPVLNETGFQGIANPSRVFHSDGHVRVSPAFKADVEAIMKELADLLISKHEDYGPKNISDSPGGPINGLLVRMHDKMARLKNLQYNNVNARHEPIEDSYKDLANYAVIALMVLRDKWDK